jgi:hypothetical protein
MTSIIGHKAYSRFARRAAAGGVAAAVLLSGLGVAGCGAVRTINKVRQNVAGNRAAIDAFTAGLKSVQSTAFEATYVTTGTSPATTVYAVRPPKDVAFREIPSGGGSGASSLYVVINASGEYACTRPASGTGPNSGWSCQKLGSVSAAVQNHAYRFYTPAHWITFLRTFLIAAGFAHDTVRSSTMTVHGFSLRCIEVHAPGISGTSTICTTAQGILGYVQVDSEPASFEITSYSTAPPAALFELPAGATVRNS